MFDTALSDPESLMKLAETRDPATRDRLAVAMAETCAARNPGDTEAGKMVSDLLISLAKEASGEIRTLLAEKLAGVGWAPRELILNLAFDEIDVADAVLKASAQLVDADLLTLIECKGLEHRVAIASRPNLSAFVSDGLSVATEPEVLTALAANRTTRLTRKTLNKCVDVAEGYEPIHDPLCQRTDLGDELANRLYAIVSDEFRRLIVERYDVNEVLLVPIVKDVREQASVSAVMKPIDWPPKDAAPAPNEISPVTREMALQAARQDRVVLLDEFIARSAGVTTQGVQRAIGLGGAWAIAIACICLNVDRSGFPPVYLAFARAGRVPRKLERDAAQEAGRAFASTTHERARDALRRLSGDA